MFVALSKQPPRQLADGNNITVLGKWAQLGGSAPLLENIEKKGQPLATEGVKLGYQQIYIKNIQGDDGVYTGEVDLATGKPHGLGRWECS